jgi:peptidoglycan hydrolase-like protein with peptidoglycan-binding domain
MRYRSGLTALLLCVVVCAFATRAAAAQREQSILVLGDRGAAVAQVQHRLGVRETGFFGLLTLHAVKRFQHRHGLLVDGQVGPLTSRALHLSWAAHVARVHFRRNTVATRHRLGSDELGIGSEGPRVAEAQRILHIRADGVFGPETQLAVERFQRAHGLPVVGWIGPHTRAALLASWRHAHAPGRPSHRRRHPSSHRHASDHASHHVRHRAARAVHHTARHRHRRHHVRGVFGLGTRGIGIAMLQVQLGVPADGIFGAETLAAVESFQARHGLTVDGRIGPATIAAMHHTRRDHRRAVRAAIAAVSQIGRPYVFGGVTRRGFDCSGLMMWAYAHAGVSIPRTTWQQYRAARSHPRRRWLRTGDLVFFSARSHVGMYLGHHLLVQAPHTGARVGIARMNGWFLHHWAGAGRVAG